MKIHIETKKLRGKKKNVKGTGTIAGDSRLDPAKG